MASDATVTKNGTDSWKRHEDIGKVLATNSISQGSEEAGQQISVGSMFTLRVISTTLNTICKQIDQCETPEQLRSLVEELRATAEAATPRDEG